MGQTGVGKGRTRVIAGNSFLLNEFRKLQNVADPGPVSAHNGMDSNGRNPVKYFIMNLL